MSLYKDASLVMIPSAYKDGKLYSIRPTDGSGDFTFSRGSNLAATRVDVNGLIEKGRENLLTQSNNFSTTWYSGGLSETSGQSGYDGSSDAWLIEALATGTRFLEQNISSGVNTFSVYAKAGTTDWIMLNDGGGSSAYFDIANGVLGSNSGADYIDHSIESISSGWYRCSLTSVNIGQARIYLAVADGNLSNSVGNNIYIQDAQLEQGLVATDYIETGTSAAQSGILEDMPRLDYSGGASCPSLLLEPQRSNLLPYSEYFETWSNVNLGTANLATITTNYATSPDGTNNATRIQFDLNGGTTLSDRVIIRQLLSTATGRYFSVWMKSATGTDQKILWHYGGDENEQTITNEWQRFEYDRTSVNLSYAGLSLRGGESSVDTADILVWGFQVELGSYPTSYIPTYGTSQTRGAEASVGSFNGDEIFSNSYTAMADLVIPHQGTIGVGAGWGARVVEGSTNLFNWSWVLVHINSTQIDLNTKTSSGGSNSNLINYTWGDRVKIIVRSDGYYFVNGTKYTLSGSGLQSAEPVEIGFGRIGNSAFSSGETTEVNQTLVFPTALTDSECIALTTI